MRALGACCVLNCALVAACSNPVAAPAPRPVRIISAVAGGSPFNRTLAGVYRAELSDTAPQVVKSAGVVESLELLEAGGGDVAYSFANLAYAAYAGQLPGREGSFQRLRAIALLQPAALHVLVGPESRARGMKDLRERPLTFSGPGAALVMTVESVLPAFGLHTGQAQRFDASLAGIEGSGLAGAEGAMMTLGVPPVKGIEAALAAGARLLPVKGREVEQLLREYPFYTDVLIPTDAYAGLAAPVVTIGVNGLLVCRADLPDELVYRLTRALYEGPTGVRPELARWLEPSAGAATPVPLHPGAARYYRERELAP
jgi:TRAP transporter TAXI family solute receptor